MEVFIFCLGDFFFWYSNLELGIFVDFFMLLIGVVLLLFDEFILIFCRFFLISRFFVIVDISFGVFFFLVVFLLGLEDCFFFDFFVLLRGVILLLFVEVILIICKFVCIGRLLFVFEVSFIDFIFLEDNFIGLGVFFGLDFFKFFICIFWLLFEVIFLVFCNFFLISMFLFVEVDICNFFFLMVFFFGLVVCFFIVLFELLSGIELLLFV